MSFIICIWNDPRNIFNSFHKNLSHLSVMQSHPSKAKLMCRDSLTLCISDANEGGSAIIAATLETTFEFLQENSDFWDNQSLIIFRLRPTKIPDSLSLSLFLYFPCLAMFKEAQRGGFELFGLGDLTFQLSSVSPPNTSASKIQIVEMTAWVHGFVDHGWSWTHSSPSQHSNVQSAADKDEDSLRWPTKKTTSGISTNNISSPTHRRKSVPPEFPPQRDAWFSSCIWLYLQARWTVKYTCCKHPQGQVWIMLIGDFRFPRS